VSITIERCGHRETRRAAEMTSSAVAIRKMARILWRNLARDDLDTDATCPGCAFRSLRDLISLAIEWIASEISDA